MKTGDARAAADHFEAARARVPNDGPILGALAGALIPESWSLDFAIPLVFMVLIIPALDRKPGIAAAIVGGVVAVTARDVPYRLGLIIAALAGIAAGVIAERRYAR